MRVRKPEVLAQLPPSGHVVIEASAGTGKTFTIEHLVLDLLLTSDTTIDQILVVTFTEKATLELRTRVRLAIESFLAKTETSTDVDDAPHWTIDDQARARLVAARDAFDTASIATIHGFCQGVLRDRAFQSQRRFAEEQVSFDDAFTRAFYDALRLEFTIDPSQKRALDAWLTGGKTIDALERKLRELAPKKGEAVVAYDVDEALRLASECLPTLQKWHEYVLGKIASSKKVFASNEKDRAALERLTHALRESILRNDPFLFACANELAFGDVAYLLERSTPEASKTLPDEFRAAIRSIARQTLTEGSLLAKVFLPVVRSRMDTRKREEGLYDFDDMLLLVRDALRGEGGAALRETLRHDLRVALIDEFQDTDSVQWEIFQRLFFDTRDDHRLILVGDPKQAIYGFRGADIAAYRRACNDILKAGGKLLRLTQNFRSSARYIDAAHRIFGPDTGFFTGHNRYEDPVSVGEHAPRLLDANGIELSAILVEDFSGNPPKASRGFKATSATAIANEIERLLDRNAPTRIQLRNGETRPLQARDIFVLTFKTNESRTVGRTLRERRIPFAFFKEEGLFRTDEARDVRDLLLAIEKPGDRGATARAMLTPFFDVALADIGGRDAITNEHPAAVRISSWRSLIESKKYAAFFSALLSDSGVARRMIFEGDERALTNYQQIFEYLQTHASSTHATVGELRRLLSNFISEAERPPEQEADMQRLESDRDAVQIMTVHKSKGLEAAVVFLFGGYSDRTFEDFYTYHDGDERKVWPGKPPEDVRALYKKERTEESERLLYVALTRAKGRFVLHYYGEKPARWNGQYLTIHSRLGPLRTQPPELFEWRAGAAIAASDENVSIETAAPTFSEGWPPTQHASNAAQRTSAMKLEHRAPLMTSYSRMARQAKADAHSRVDDRGTELTPTRIVEATAENALPAGVTTGLFLHEFLELVDLDAVRESPSLDAFRHDERIASLLTDTMRSYAMDGRFRDHAESILYDAVTRDVPLGARRIAGLATATRILREPEFIYPIPESTHVLLGVSRDEQSRYTVERGYIKGYIDLIFEHEGLSYVLDWKSDTLPSYDDSTIRVHAEAQYGIQARLYAIALSRMLGVETKEDYERSFGGLVYFFLRSERTEGIYFMRPSFEELKQWERELVARERWG